MICWLTTGLGRSDPSSYSLLHPFASPRHLTWLCSSQKTSTPGPTFSPGTSCVRGSGLYLPLFFGSPQHFHFPMYVPLTLSPARFRPLLSNPARLSPFWLNPARSYPSLSTPLMLNPLLSYPWLSYPWLPSPRLFWTLLIMADIGAWFDSRYVGTVQGMNRDWLEGRYKKIVM